MELSMENEKKVTGYPSIDKPWLKYYSDEAINAPLPECTMYEYLWKNNKDNLNSTALNYFGRKMTYGKLFESIDRTAAAFIAWGVKEGDTVTLLMLSCVPSVLCLYALNRIGAVPNYINVLSSEDEIKRYVEEAESRYMVTLDLFGEKVKRAVSDRKILVCSLADYMPLPTKAVFKLKTRKNAVVPNGALTWKRFLALADKEMQGFYEKDPHTLCFLAHTGGTTGFPKSVMLSDIAFNTVTQNYVLSMPHKRGEVFLNIIIPFVVYGTLVNVHMPLCLGLETVLIPKFDPADWSKYLKKYHPDHCCGIPAYILPMYSDEKLADADLSGLKTVGLGGDGMNSEQEVKINEFLAGYGSSAEVLTGYGMTEVCATAILSFAHAHRAGSVDIPLVGNNVMIYDTDNERECKYGETGEICLDCASQMLGYKDNPQEENQLIRIHKEGSRWLHSGDLGYVDSDGFLYMKGRLKRFIMTVGEGKFEEPVILFFTNPLYQKERSSCDCFFSRLSFFFYLFSALFCY